MSDFKAIYRMPQTTLVRAEIACSRLGFGGSRLHYLATPQERLDILETAYACGINYFDVAPVYGHGLAERALGSFLKRHAAEREQLVVATKWGLPAATWTDRIPEGGLRYAVAMEVLRRKLWGTPARPALTPSLLVKSVEASLRRLGTPYIDILWMHEPEPESIPDPEAVCAALRTLRAQGKLRFAGFAGYPSQVERTLEAFAQATHLDMPMLRQCDEQGWTSEDLPDVTFGVISQGPQRRAAPRIDCATAGERLRAALARRERGIVLISTTRPDNLRQMAEHAGAI